MAASDLDERIDALYGLPLEDFVAARDALVRELRGEKRREEAAEVKALRRPGVAAWAVNQVVRTQRPAVRDLWAAGDELVEAQRALVAGEADRARLREAMTGRREALAPVVAALRGLLGGRGKGLAEGTVQEAVETLTAASVDPAVRELVAPGRLGETVATTGFEAAAGPEAEPASEPEPDPEPATPKPAKRAPKQPSAAERRKAEAARKAEAEAARRRRDARRTAQRALDKAVRARETAASRADRAQAALREAQESERAAREALEGAAAAEAEAREALERLEADGD